MACCGDRLYLEGKRGKAGFGDEASFLFVGSTSGDTSTFYFLTTPFIFLPVYTPLSLGTSAILFGQVSPTLQDLSTLTLYLPLAGITNLTLSYQYDYGLTGSVTGVSGVTATTINGNTYTFSLSPAVLTYLSTDTGNNLFNMTAQVYWTDKHKKRRHCGPECQCLNVRQSCRGRDGFYDRASYGSFLYASPTTTSATLYALKLVGSSIYAPYITLIYNGSNVYTINYNGIPPTYKTSAIVLYGTTLTTAQGTQTSTGFTFTVTNSSPFLLEFTLIFS